MRVSTIIADAITNISNLARNFYDNANVLNISIFQMIVDIGLIAVMCYYLLVFIRETRAYGVLKGFIVLAVIYLASKMFSLIAVDWLMNRLLTGLIIAIPILFQHELRDVLERIGRTRRFLGQMVQRADFIISNVIEACVEIKKEKRGALIVFEGSIPLTECIDSGVAINGTVSRDLLVAIFQTHSPLHDGAVILQDGNIKSAASVLPHSFKNYEHIHGTRHKAALALSESTDAKIILISEEKNTIGWIEKGKIEAPVTPERLQQLLAFLRTKPKKIHR